MVLGSSVTMNPGKRLGMKINGGGNETVAGNKPDEYNRGGYERGGNETVGGNEPLGGGNEAVSGGNGTVRGGNETVGGENEAVNVGNETGGGGNGNKIVDRAEGGRRDAYATLVSADDAESQSETAQSETATGSEISPPESEPAPVASTKGKHKAAEVPRTESAAFSRQGEWNGEGEDLTGGRNLPLGGRNNSAGFAATGGDDEVGGTGVRFARDGGGGAELASTGAEGGESTGFPLLKEGGRGMKLAATGSGGDNTGFSVLIEEGAGQGKGEKGSDNGFRTGVAGMGLGLGLGRRSKASIFRQSSGHLSSLASSSAHGEFRGGFGQRAVKPSPWSTMPPSPSVPGDDRMGSIASIPIGGVIGAGAVPVKAEAFVTGTEPNNPPSFPPRVDDGLGGGGGAVVPPHALGPAVPQGTLTRSRLSWKNAEELQTPGTGLESPCPDASQDDGGRAERPLSGRNGGGGGGDGGGGGAMGGQGGGSTEPEVAGGGGGEEGGEGGGGGGEGGGGEGGGRGGELADNPAVGNGRHCSVEAVQSGDVRVVQTFLDRGGDVETRDSRINMTLLGWAARLGHIDLARLLLSFGASVQAGDGKMRTPLHRACTGCNSSVVKVLLEHGADPNACDSTSRTPLHRAARWGSPDCSVLLLDAGADIEARDEELARTPLHYASRSGGLDTTLVLLQNGADFDAKTVAGNTPLHLACDRGLVRNVELLLEWGADVNCLNEAGAVPAEVAAPWVDDAVKANLRVLLSEQDDQQRADRVSSRPLPIVIRPRPSGAAESEVGLMESIRSQRNLMAECPDCQTDLLRTPHTLNGEGFSTIHRSMSLGRAGKPRVCSAHRSRSRTTEGGTQRSSGSGGVGVDGKKAAMRSWNHGGGGRGGGRGGLGGGARGSRRGLGSDRKQLSAKIARSQKNRDGGVRWWFGGGGGRRG
eukprot:jgi/Undpi1/4724/HiC_scaffold_18.g08077.m1